MSLYLDSTKLVSRRFRIGNANELQPKTLDSFWISLPLRPVPREPSFIADCSWCPCNNFPHSGNLTTRMGVVQVVQCSHIYVGHTLVHTCQCNRTTYVLRYTILMFLDKQFWRIDKLIRSNKTDCTLLQMSVDTWPGLSDSLKLVERSDFQGFQSTLWRAASGHTIYWSCQCQKPEGCPWIWTLIMTNAFHQRTMTAVMHTPR